MLYDEFDSMAGEGLGHGKTGEVLNVWLARLVKDRIYIVVSQSNPPYRPHAGDGISKPIS
jgi:hypothetical protein